MAILRTDYFGAARRHWDDAALLEAHDRLANAGQLYGFVAECGVKAVLTWHGYAVADEPRSGLGFKTHINKLAGQITFQRLALFLSGRSGARHLAQIPSIGNFADWDVAHRYYAEPDLPPSLPKWKAAASEVGRLLDQARLDGLG